MVGLQFEKIRKTEELGNAGVLIWLYSSSASINGKFAGVVSDTTEKDCQAKIDYALANPDEYISKQMSSGNL